MCDFKPGDEVERISYGGAYTSSWACDPKANEIGARATVLSVFEHIPGHFGLFFEEFWTEAPAGFAATAWRKVQRRNSSLTIEAFFTVPGGFEEPKRPAKTREKA